MLAAMAVGNRARFANRVDLMTVGTWVVPAGVTTVNVYAATRGGNAASLLGWGYGEAGGGGGGAILNCALTVTPGNTLTGTFSSLSLRGQFDVENTTTATSLFMLETGWTPVASGMIEGGDGAKVEWYQGGTTTALRGARGTGAGGVGGNGQRWAVAGGSILSGGGGGAPALLLPQGTGGSGGAADTFSGIAGNQPNGGGGGGFIPGQYSIANARSYVPDSFASNGFCFLEWN